MKIKYKWNYLLELFNVKLNTLVSIKLVESKYSKTIYQFLHKSLRNQEKISIETDLKHKYNEVIDKLTTKNKIENIFQKKIFPKHMKRTMKIEQGLLRRLMLKLNHWNIKNEKRPHKFLKVPKFLNNKQYNYQ